MSKVLDEKINKMKPEEQKLWALRHTAEHILHTALQNLYPKLKKAMGPATPEGFYTDFDLDDKITEDLFEKIEIEMKRIIKLNLPMIQEDIKVEEARNIFKNNPYKLEWVDEIEKRGEKVSTYRMGDEEIDLCSGPHIASTGEVKAFKLLSVAGAYWHGDEKNKMLTRVYGTAFLTQKELDEFLNNIEEAKKRDHRKLGRDLDLFSFSEYVGSGMPLYSPKGTLIRNLLNKFIEDEQIELDYEQVWTPQIAKAELFKISGHYDKYKDDMFTVHSHYSKEEFFLKPMNCPQHTQIYASRPRTYKDLPLRLTDFAMLYRDEKPGELIGLARTRSFSQDDCHIFCREDQVDEEVDKALAMTKKVMNTLGLKYKYRLSTRDPLAPEKYLGDPKIWDKVEAWAIKIMKRNKIEYYDGPGEAAFYAPKMDLIATDSLNREWQLSTVQIDYVQPERFGLEYINENGEKSMPVMIHRAILGSAERLMMILIEHFAGNFPTWLTPVQVKILPLTERNLVYANDIYDKLKKNGIRVEIDERNETLGGKIRNAQMEKVAYMLIVGDKEEKDKTISVRKRDGKNLDGNSLEDFIKDIKKEIEEKLIT